jgi:23S rRNA pseudouridine2605 synthase
MRINKFIALHIGVSRRQADEMIKKNHVKISQNSAQLSDQVDDEKKVSVFYKGAWRELGSKQKSRVVLIYKSIFTASTRDDDQKRKTIYDAIPPEYRLLKPAGRLDYLSEGLMVLSNNGDLIHQLIHPKNGSEKHYIVGLNEPLSEENIENMEKGMKLDGYKLNPMIVEYASVREYSYLKLDLKKTWYLFVLSEGRNNQIRKVCKIFGQNVFRLIRIKHGQFDMSEELYKKKFLDISKK